MFIMLGVNGVCPLLVFIVGSDQPHHFAVRERKQSAASGGWRIHASKCNWTNIPKMLCGKHERCGQA
jgi:hypothetical protein